MGDDNQRDKPSSIGPIVAVGTAVIGAALLAPRIGRIISPSSRPVIVGANPTPFDGGIVVDEMGNPLTDKAGNALPGKNVNWGDVEKSINFGLKKMLEGAEAINAIITESIKRNGTEKEMNGWEEWVFPSDYPTTDSKKSDYTFLAHARRALEKNLFNSKGEFVGGYPYNEAIAASSLVPTVLLGSELRRDGLRDDGQLEKLEALLAGLTPSEKEAVERITREMQAYSVTIVFPTANFMRRNGEQWRPGKYIRPFDTGTIREGTNPNR